MLTYLCNCFETRRSPGISRRSFGRLSTSFAFASLAGRASAQQPWQFGLKDSCTFYGSEVVEADVYTFGTPEEGMDVVKKITTEVGLSPNFEVMQANVPNAAAVIRDGTRYIFYSQVFIDQIRKQTNEWAAWTILAHEIGHHLNGHTLLQGGSRPPIELEADRFAGFAVKRMGGTLDQAKSPYQSASEKGSKTHPPKSARLEAVTAGWNQAAGKEQPPQQPGNSLPTAGNPGALLEATIRQVQSGSLPRHRMVPGMAEVIQPQLPGASAFLQQIGPIVNIQLTSQQQLPQGALYHFRVQFARGLMDWQLGIAPDGAMNTLWFQQAYY